MSSATVISYRGELMRKGIHLFSILIPIVAWHLDRVTAVVLLMWMFIISLVIDVLRFQPGPAGDFLRWMLSPIARPHETRGKFGYRRLTGSTWMLLAAVITFAVFPREIAVAAFAMLILCDTAAALVGRRYGRLRYGPKEKTLEGSAAFFAAGIVVAACVPGLPVAVGITGAFAATLAEGLLPEMDDNFTVPIVAGLVMMLLMG